MTIQEKKERTKFTTTLTEEVIKKIDYIKVLENAKGKNDIIEKLVLDKWEELQNV